MPERNSGHEDATRVLIIILMLRFIFIPFNAMMFISSLLVGKY